MQTKDETDAKPPHEDLNLQPALGQPRPPLRYLCPPDGSPSPESGLRMDSMQHLLSIWNTLNVHCEIYVLDSFTFDDFVDAMRFSAPGVDCELLDEIHCAVLKQLVDTEGKVQIELPDLDSDDDLSDAESEAMDTQPSHARSRLSVVENASDSDKARPRRHRAHDLLDGFDWIDRLGRRQLSNGGWQSILVGVLRQAMVGDKAACEPILAHLCPIDQDATPETVQMRYASLDINLRIVALEAIVFMTLTTKAVRAYLETCSEDMTETRKLKTDQTRKKKEL